MTIVFSTQFCLAQSPDLSKANAYFERTFYSDAIPLYETVVEKQRTFDIIKNLADAYYYTNDLKNAERWYQFLIKNYSSQIDDAYYFKYSHTLKASGKYEEANQISRSRIK